MRTFDLAGMIIASGAVTDADKWRAVSYIREEMLKETDWTQGDILKYTKRIEFQVYRKALIDIDASGVYTGNFALPVLPTISASDYATQGQLDTQAAAHTFAINIPNWATWAQSDLTTWWNANLADTTVDGFAIPAGVKTMLKAQNLAILRIGQMVIAIRDFVKIVLNGV